MATNLKITSCTTTTAGVTEDGCYSLAINEVNGEPCLCVHRCEPKGGLHYSPMNYDSLVTAISKSKLERVLEMMEWPAWSRKRQGADT
jgi:hypothetical protein